MTIICDICGNAYKDRHKGYRNGFICAKCYNLGDIEELKNVVKLRIERTKKRLSVLEELGVEIREIKGKIDSFEDKLLKDKEYVPQLFRDKITKSFKAVSTDETNNLFTLIEDKIPVLIDKNKLLTDQIKQFKNLKGKDVEYEKEIEKLKKEIEGLNKKIDTLTKNKEKTEELAKPDNSIGMKFTLVTADEFNMGSEESDDEKPVHKVKIKNPFYLGTYPVTQREWKAVMGNNSNPSNFKGDNLPVEQVSWDKVQEFIKKFNEKEGTDKYRLPSEAEWEYACRVGTTTRYSFGDDESKLGDCGWYAENSGSRSPKKGDYFGYDKDDWLENRWKGKTHSVGQKKPNTWGLCDMHGNVWEWVQDGWHDGYDGAPTDGSDWESGDGADRVVRGGSWYCSAGGCRSASRNHLDPRDRHLGFRILQEL